MRVQVTFELGEADDKLEIPWESHDGAIRYFDLREQPRALEQIEEARRHLPLRSFLAAVNSTDSVFATAKCDTWLKQDEPGSPEAEGGPYEFASYVDLVFALEDFNFERGHYEGLTKRLEELMTRGAAADTLRAELCVRHCHFRNVAGWGFYLTIFLCARGSTPEQAELRWGLGLARLQQALLFISRVIRHQLPQRS